jgi:hypothetical protein
VLASLTRQLVFYMGQVLLVDVRYRYESLVQVGITFLYLLIDLDKFVL